MIGRLISSACHTYVVDQSMWLIDINDSNLVPQRFPVNGGRRSISNLLESLDSRVNPGVTGDEFRRLIVRCCSCGQFTTRRAFRNHKCQNEVIDLTGDD